ncbi:hypothetical protein ACFQZC_37270 [Streptacidiphilus monticola]
MNVSKETIDKIARELFEAKRGVYTVPYVSPGCPNATSTRPTPSPQSSPPCASASWACDGWAARSA